MNIRRWTIKLQWRGRKKIQFSKTIKWNRKLSTIEFTIYRRLKMIPIRKTLHCSNEFISAYQNLWRKETMYVSQAKQLTNISQEIQRKQKELQSNYWL